VPLGDRRIAFVKSEINDWIAGWIAARPANDNGPTKTVEAA
jgi:prophage regulatory protein